MFRRLRFGKLIDYYLLRHIVESTLQGLAWFAGLLVAVSFITALQKLVHQSLSLSSMIPLVIYQLPRIIVFTLPMSVLYGTVQSFTELSGGGELISMLAAGASFLRLMRAPLVWGVALSLTTFWMQETIVPTAEVKKDRLMAHKLMESASLGHFRWEDPPNGTGPLKRLIQADSFDPKTKTLINPVIQFYAENQHLYLQISAARGTWDQTTDRWRFTNGQLINIDNSSRSRSGEYSSGFSTRMTFETMERDSAPSPQVLGGAGKTLRDHLRHGDFELLSLLHLRDYQRRLQADLRAAERKRQPDDASEARTLLSISTYGVHDKIATPLICLALVLIGAPLGVRPQRSRAGVSMGLSLLVLLLYYGLWSWTSTLGDAGRGNPVLLAYLPLALTTSVGCGLVWRKNR